MCKHMYYPFCLNHFKEKDNLRNTVVSQTSTNCFKFWYLVQDVIHLFIHALDICWALIKYQAYIVGLYVFISLNLNNNEPAS